MYQRNTSGLKPPFQKGVSGNPSGRPRFRLTAEHLRKIIDKFAFMTRNELQAAIHEDTTPMMELWVASIVAQGAKSGDYSRFAALLDRSIGRPSHEAQDHIREELAALTKDQLIERMETDLLRLKNSG